MTKMAGGPNLLHVLSLELAVGECLDFGLLPAGDADGRKFDETQWLPILILIHTAGKNTLNEHAPKKLVTN